MSDSSTTAAIQAQRPWLAIVAAFILTLAVMVAGAFAWVFIYSLLVSPGGDHAYYDAYAQVASPVVAVVLAFPIFFLMGRFMRRYGSQARFAALAVVGINLALDALAVGFAAQDIGYHITMSLLAAGLKVAGAIFWQPTVELTVSWDRASADEPMAVLPMARLPAYIQANLDASLTLEDLAEEVGLSVYQLHRRFKAQAGETLARYVARQRLHEAALALVTFDETILDIGLRHGFANHETFTRAFRRQFGTTPSAFRARGQLNAEPAPPPATTEAIGRPADTSARGAGSYTLSATRLQLLRPAPIATLRHVGPYERTPPSLWHQLTAFAKARRLRPGPLLGIGWDNPQNTSPDSLRFDAALIVDRTFRGDDDIHCSTLPPGPYALTRHIGPYASLPAAYPKIAAQSLALPDFRPLGGPAIEIFRTTQMRSNRALEFTDVLLAAEASGALSAGTT